MKTLKDRFVVKDDAFQVEGMFNFSFLKKNIFKIFMTG